MSTETTMDLQTEAACTRLCLDFARAVDLHDDATALALFTTDGLLDTPARRFAGQAELSAFLDGRPRSVRTRHVCGHIRITPTGAGQAQGLCYVVCFKAAGAADGNAVLATPLPHVVEYHDRYRQTPQGWRIAERRITPVFDPDLTPAPRSL